MLPICLVIVRISEIYRVLSKISVRRLREVVISSSLHIFRYRFASDNEDPDEMFPLLYKLNSEDGNETDYDDDDDDDDDDEDD